MAKYLRRWHYEHYFLGELIRDLPLEMTEDEVMELLNRECGRDNWKNDTPKKRRKGKD